MSLDYFPELVVFFYRFLREKAYNVRGRIPTFTHYKDLPSPNVDSTKIAKPSHESEFFG